MTERLDEGQERKRGGKDESKVFGLSNLKDEIAINLDGENVRKNRFYRYGQKIV